MSCYTVLSVNQVEVFKCIMLHDVTQPLVLNRVKSIKVMCGIGKVKGNNIIVIFGWPLKLVTVAPSVFPIDD